MNSWIRGHPVLQAEHEKDRDKAGDDDGVAHEAFERKIIGPEGFLDLDVHTVHILIDGIPDELVTLHLLVIVPIIDDIYSVSSIVGAGVERECIRGGNVEMDPIEGVFRTVIPDEIIELTVIEIDTGPVVPRADVPRDRVAR